jgi:hypothetical protein
MVNVAVKVMQGDNPVVGATTSSSGWKYSPSFDIIPNTPFNLQFASPDWSSHVSDANGVLRFYAWPTESQTINVNNVVNGLTQRGSVTTAITAGMSMVTVQMPPAPGELTGRLLDFDGDPQVGWTVLGGNNDGTGRGVTDANGAFSMFVPNGDISISLEPAPTQNGLTGPDTVTNSGSSFTWNAAEDGNLEMTIPRAVKVSVLVTDNGEPVQGARGFSQGWNYSDEFNSSPRPIMVPTRLVQMELLVIIRGPGVQFGLGQLLRSTRALSTERRQLIRHRVLIPQCVLNLARKLQLAIMQTRHDSLR